jgi:hypothetical protein
MDTDIKQFYETYLKQLGWRDKLELIELLMSATVESVREEEKKELNPSEQPSSIAQNEGNYTDLQKQLLNGPVMAEEDYELYKEKKKHFDAWK